jgi:transposase InsO family protein
MPWNEVEMQEQRIRFAVLAERGEQTMAALCREFDISRQAGYKWLSRYREQGVAGVVERSRRPRSSPGRTPDELEQRVVEQRRNRPDWGARKLQVMLVREGVELPVITIHRILLRHGLVHKEDRVRPATKRFEREQPNELWQMDFKGMPQVFGAGGLLPLSILDDHSRYLLGLRAQQQTAGEPVRQALEEIFEAVGMPERMLMDHGVPWWNMQGAGWTRLSVWLMQQGIQLRFSGYRHPQTQGKVERMHGSMQRALLRRGWPRRRQDWQGWLDAFRAEYNDERPHESLGMATPASRWRPSARAYEPRAKSWEYPEGSWVLRVGVNGGLYLLGGRWEVSRALAGQYVALEQSGERILVRYCRTTVRELDLTSGRSLPVPVNPNDFVWPDPAPVEPAD